MDPQQTALLPARPDSLPGWEDLLVRFEIMPRALRVTLEEAGRDPSTAAKILRRILESEALFSAWIEAASPGGSPPDGPGDPREELPRPPGAGGTSDPRALADRFGSLRSRNFAMLQRRGVDVWEWTAALDGAGPVTAYQMVSALVREDAAALRELREGLRLGAAAC